MPEEPANGVVKPIETEMANTDECAQENNQTEIDQASGLSSEERDAKIEELKNEKKRLGKYLMGQIGRDRAEKEGLDINEIRCKFNELCSELHKLDVEKGLEEGYYVRTDDGAIVSKKECHIKLPFWERWFYRLF